MKGKGKERMEKQIIVEFLNYEISNLSNKIVDNLNKGSSIRYLNERLEYMKSLTDNIDTYIKEKTVKEDEIKASFKPSYLNDSEEETEEE